MNRIEKKDIDPASFDHQLDLRIDWSEMDVLGHVNNIMINKYFQAARVDLWGTLGIDTRFDKLKVAPMVASTYAQFFKPLYFPGNIEIRSKVAFVKNSSYAFEHIIISNSGELVAYGSDAIVNYDFKEDCSVQIADDLRSKLLKFT